MFFLLHPEAFPLCSERSKCTMHNLNLLVGGISLYKRAPSPTIAKIVEL